MDRTEPTRLHQKHSSVYVLLLRLGKQNAGCLIRFQRPLPEVASPCVALSLPASGAGRVMFGEAEECMFDPFPGKLPEVAAPCVAFPLPGGEGQVAIGEAEACWFDRFPGLWPFSWSVPATAVGRLAAGVIADRAGVPALLLRLGWGDTRA